MKRKKKIVEDTPPEFLVINYNAEYFAGIRGGYFYWSSSFEEAKVFNEIEKYNSILRYEPHKHPELVYVNDL